MPRGVALQDFAARRSRFVDLKDFVAGYGEGPAEADATIRRLRQWMRASSMTAQIGADTIRLAGGSPMKMLAPDDSLGCDSNLFSGIWIRYSALDRNSNASEFRDP